MVIGLRINLDGSVVAGGLVGAHTPLVERFCKVGDSMAAILEP